MVSFHLFCFQFFGSKNYFLRFKPKSNCRLIIHPSTHYLLLHPHQSKIKSKIIKNKSMNQNIYLELAKKESKILHLLF